ncbi:MAG: AAA family ATPase [Proteobacteria bacterium]|nr:AAA family ATPase [Pseudomonadota bacterium]
MHSERKKLPIGIQSFEQLIREGAVYVDKTKNIYEILKPGFGAYFLSRPRRFGKSLLVSTLEAIFKNKRHLFKGLWLDSSDYVWEEFPVIKIDMSSVSKKTNVTLNQALKEAVNDNALREGITLEDKEPERMFQLLIHALVKKYNQQVVILIDEYDDPILKHINDPEMAGKNREVLQDFYKIMKSESGSLRFVFLTGVSKFAKTSIFSGLNNLLNISMSDKYATLLGYTQEELESYFPEYISELAESHSLSIDEILNKIKFWYNGYRFSKAENKVYNPFSSLLLFETKEFVNHWFVTGTPTFLIELIKRSSVDLQSFEDLIEIPEYNLNVYDVESLPLIPIMFDAGYLTLVKQSLMGNDIIYGLSYPNYEVKNSLVSGLLNEFSEKDSGSISSELLQISRSIINNDLEKFFSLLKSYFASIPYDLIPKKELNEKYFQLIFYLLMRVTSFRVNTEDRTNLGRIDLMLETDTSIYLFELKVNSSAAAALKQIKEKKYYEKYLHIPAVKPDSSSEAAQDKAVYIIGLNLSLEERNISEYLVENIKH